MTSSAPPGWPPDVEQISFEDFERLGFNSHKELFWDGNRVEVRRRLALTRFQKIVAIIVTICAIMGGLGGFVSGFNNASVFLCARHITYLSCPTP